MTYTLTLDGLPLHYYGGGIYGWGSISSTGQSGQLVEWTMRCEVDDWMQAHPVFSAGAIIVKGY